jgi:putative NADH-flavin reductase
VNSDKAKALTAEGVEMVKADLSNKEEVKRALENVDIVYGVTNFWDPEIFLNDVTLEAKQGKFLADAAKENKLSWFLWSSAPNVATQSNGKIKHVDHFNGKLSSWY